MIDESTLRRRLHNTADEINARAGLVASLDGRIAGHERRARARRLSGAAVMSALVVLTAVVGVVLRADRSSELSSPTPRSDTAGWSAIAAAPIEARFQHTAVAMDGKVLVFGGYNGSGRAHGAAVFDPESGSWDEVSGPPGDVGGASAVWADGRVLAIDLDGKLLAFDPKTRSWSSEGQSPFGETANAVTAMAWTGDELLVVNSAANSKGSAIYNPATGAWRALPAPPFELAFFDTAWTGTELLVAADTGASGKSYSRLAVLALDPAKGAWRELPAPPLANVERRSNGFAVWTGSELVVGGGFAATEEAAAVSATLVAENLEPTAEERDLLAPRAANDAAAWNPTTSQWRALPSAPVPVTGNSRYAEAWTGSQVIAWSAEPQRQSFSGSTGQPVLLDPTTGTWTVGDAMPAGSHQEAPATWTGVELIIWSGEPTATDDAPEGCCKPSNTGYSFRP